MAQLAIAWTLKNQHVTTVILGATKLHQLEENLGSLRLLGRMDLATMADIERILANAPAEERDWNFNPTTTTTTPTPSV